MQQQRGEQRRTELPRRRHGGGGQKGLGETGDRASNIYREARMPDEDKYEVGHRDCIMQHWNRHMDDLQKSDMLQ
eukprot:10575778-Heterocapsa_arctica.AAC.1